MQAVVDLGLLNDSPQPFLQVDAPSITWVQFDIGLIQFQNDLLRKLLDIPEGTSTKIGLKQKLRSYQGFPSKGYSDDQIRKVCECFKW